MAVMYSIIAQELEKSGLSDQYHPQDYLNFYCLGKRDPSSSESSSQVNQQTDNRALVSYFYLLWELYEVATTKIFMMTLGCG